MEVLRGLRRLGRRGLLERQVIFAGLENLEQIGLHVDEANPIERLATIHRLAERHSITAADAAYLDVASRLDMRRRSCTRRERDGDSSVSALRSNAVGEATQGYFPSRAIKLDVSQRAPPIFCTSE